MSVRPEEFIPLVDLSWQHCQIAAEVEAGIAEVMASTAFVQGPAVGAFEREFAAFCGVRHCVGVGNGTDALELSLRAVGVRPGDAVVLPTNTFVATAEAVVRAGGRPVLVDCNELGLIDPESVAERSGADVRAIIPVHLYGQMADMAALGRAVEGRDVMIVEDAAQAQGARRFGHGIASYSAIAGTSFYPGKNLGAYGDAGAVITNDDDLAATVRRLANHGSEGKYIHTEVGCNSRLDTVQAVVLRSKLARLDAWNAARRRSAARYHELLMPLEERGLVRRPVTDAGNDHVWHLYTVRVHARDDVLRQLLATGIGAGIHYPVPIHLQGAFRWLGHSPGDFPIAEQLSSELLSLPMYPGLTAWQQEQVVEQLEKALVSPLEPVPAR